MNEKEKFALRARDHLDTSEGKRHFNEKHFAESASRYDLATRGLSLGQDRSWKRKLVAGLADAEAPRCVDIACGTGDVAFLLGERFPGGEVLGVDLTADMITVAEKRNRLSNVRFSRGDMSRLPLPDDSVDILTGSYAIRNAPDLEETLEEFARVMKPGGQLAFLDFSKPDAAWLQAIQFGLLRIWGNFWGLVLHGNPEVHGYISSSLKTFPERSRLRDIYARHGFRLVSSQRFLTGMMRLDFLRFERSNTESSS